MTPAPVAVRVNVDQVESRAGFCDQEVGCVPTQRRCCSTKQAGTFTHTGRHCDAKRKLALQQLRGTATTVARVGVSVVLAPLPEDSPELHGQLVAPCSVEPCVPLRS